MSLILKILLKRLRAFGFASLVILPIAGCYTPSGGALDEGIGFRQARFAEMTLVREYRSCRDSAFELDTQARTTGDIGKYMASAKMLESCESGLGAAEGGLLVDERLRAYAVATQNRLKTGDIEGARTNLNKLKGAFPGKDLYLADGSSFIESMEILLGLRDRNELAEFATLNVGDELKKELRRVRYWKRH